MQRKVEIRTDKQGVAYRDVDKILTKLAMDDQVASVNLEKVSQGGRQY